MMMRNFSKAVRRMAFERAAGKCEICGATLMAGRIHYDHVIPWAISHSSALSNCQPLCEACHGEKTAQRDLPAIAKVVRIRDGMMAARTARRLMQGGRGSNFRKTIGGAVVPRISQAEAHREMIARRYGKFEQ